MPHWFPHLTACAMSAEGKAETWESHGGRACHPGTGVRARVCDVLGRQKRRVWTAVFDMVTVLVVAVWICGL